MVRAIPVGLVVRLPRCHESMGLVNQIVPIAHHDSSDEAIAPQLVEWSSGVVTVTRDVDGLTQEEGARRRHFFQLAPCVGGSGAAAGAASTMPGVTLNPPHIAKFATMQCRHLDTSAAESAKTDVVAAADSDGNAALSVRGVAREQLKRLRWWAEEHQQLAAPPRSMPRRESGPLPFLSVDAPRLHVTRAKIVPADERAPWAYVPSALLQHLGGVQIHGANVPFRRGGGTDQAWAAATPVVGVAKLGSPHDVRYVSAGDFANALRAAHVAGNDRRVPAHLRRLQDEAHVAAEACLVEHLKARLYIAAEVYWLRPHYATDADVRDHVQRLLDWYDRHGSVQDAIAGFEQAGLFAPGRTEAQMLDELRQNTDALRHMVLEPDTLPHACESAKMARSQRRSNTAPRVAAIAASLEKVLAATTAMGRTPSSLELAIFRPRGG
jgi:hypothetical protein